MGIQIHAGDNYRRVVELVQGGAIGPVREAHVWVSRAWGLQSEEAAARNKDIVFVTARPTEAVEVPADLEWDLWLGPAPDAPVPSRLRARPEVVSLVGFRERDDERPRQPLERPAVLGAQTPGAADDRGDRRTRARRDRAGHDDGDLHLRGARRRCRRSR